MTPLFHPHLVNDRFGDPALYIEFLFERRGILFDLGDLHRLPSRKLLRLTHVCISHAHVDHFTGFDQLLRVTLGRDMTLHLFGPAGFVDRVRHKLAGYTWNLVDRFATDLAIRVSEVDEGERAGRRAEFRLKSGFAGRDLGEASFADGIVADEVGFRIRSAVLDHGIPSLAFALEEKLHVNVSKPAVEQAGFRVGPWLRDLRQATQRGDDEDRPFRVWWQDGGRIVEHTRALGELQRTLLTIVPGQKIAYVVDAAYTPGNIRRIVDLAAGADTLYIEASFLEADAAMARDKRHLTAVQAGTIARAAGVRRIVPFHFSARYTGRDDLLATEAAAAFTGDAAVTDSP
jgi:ribonuclease Z